MKYLLDCDPGIDDAMAIMFLAKSGVDLVGITTVHGNLDVETNAKNALKVLELVDRADIPVAIGEGNPIKGEKVSASHVHGEDGLGNTNLPDPKNRPYEGHGVDFLKEKISENKDNITVVATGPLTNVSRLLYEEPSLAHYIHELVMLGGAINVPGNISRVAEFNIYADPHAASYVFDSSIGRKTLVTSDAAMQVILTHEKLEEEIRRYRNERNAHLADFLKQLAIHYQNIFISDFQNIGDIYFNGCAMYDPLTVAYAIKNDVVTRVEQLRVDVELYGEFTKGETVAELRGGARKTIVPNLYVCLDADAPKFFEYFFSTVLG